MGCQALTSTGLSHGIPGSAGRAGRVLDALIVMEHETEVGGGILPADRLLRRVHRKLLGDPARHRPADDLAVPCADDGCQVEPALRGVDVGDVAYP